MDHHHFNHSASAVGGNLLPERLYSLLLHCSHAFSRSHHPDKGIYPGQWRILSFLATHGPITQRDLLDVAQIRSASLSELLRKLEGKKLITRSRDAADRRNVNVAITEWGRKTIDENAHIQQATADELFAVLSDVEQEQLALLLDKLLETWRQKHHGSSRHTHDDDYHHHPQGESNSPEQRH
ncbi:MAG: MarR family transcriptional regulator [Peptococcaceae bacterium]|jgi:DNA-binding MarR family transcriptional regulator|nr:MarR family transcriptional regulator [Peptococcaceae bacterium]